MARELQRRALRSWHALLKGAVLRGNHILQERSCDLARYQMAQQHDIRADSAGQEADGLGPAEEGNEAMAHADERCNPSLQERPYDSSRYQMTQQASM